MINNNTIENKLLTMQQLDHQMKVLKAQYDKLKEELVESYFSKNEEFVGSDGLVMATYKKQVRMNFMGSEFKKDYPDMYKLYSAEQALSVFSLKK